MSSNRFKENAIKKIKHILSEESGLTAREICERYNCIEKRHRLKNTQGLVPNQVSQYLKGNPNFVKDDSTTPGTYYCNGDVIWQ